MYSTINPLSELDNYVFIIIVIIMLRAGFPCISMFMFWRLANAISYKITALPINEFQLHNVSIKIMLMFLRKQFRNLSLCFLAKRSWKQIFGTLLHYKREISQGRRRQCYIKRLKVPQY